MQIVESGRGPLFNPPVPDGVRAFFATKSRARTDKRMTAKQVIARFIPNGCYLAIGGFGANRIPTAVIHEILRARRTGMAFLGHTSTHDFQLLAAGNCFNRMDAAYIITAERLVSNLEIRNDPGRTDIPFYPVDAVVKSPFGSYPGNMPYEYFSDEKHLKTWLEVEKDPDEFTAFLNRHIYGVEHFEDYLALCGGLARLSELWELEMLVDK